LKKGRNGEGCGKGSNTSEKTQKDRPVKMPTYEPYPYTITEEGAWKVGERGKRVHGKESVGERTVKTGNEKSKLRGGEGGFWKEAKSGKKRQLEKWSEWGKKNRGRGGGFSDQEGAPYFVLGLRRGRGGCRESWTKEKKHLKRGTLGGAPNNPAGKTRGKSKRENFYGRVRGQDVSMGEGDGTKKRGAY